MGHNLIYFQGSQARRSSGKLFINWNYLQIYARSKMFDE